MAFFSLSIFLSAFLLFQIQPMVGRFILPWFGGTPAVWSTLMLVFQVLLTGGYAYASWLIGRGRQQWIIHMAMLVFALILLTVRGLYDVSPIMPSRPSFQNSPSPILDIVKLLVFSVDLPFFILASNGPIMQAWFSRLYPARPYARLYAFSNIGSLLGLLLYPILVEPNLSLRIQGWIWYGGFVVFGVLTGWITFQTRRATRSLPNKLETDSFNTKPLARLSFALLSLWVALSATASLFLLSITNQISQEVAVIPFLWILPLTIYLLSFILTFSSERGYNRKFYQFLFILFASLTLFVMLNATKLHVYWQILVYCLLLFSACMLCHGELYLLRPPAENLTTFYLMVSIGGALGGIFVSLISPLIFNGYWEFFVGLAMTMAILLTVIRNSKPVTLGEAKALSERARFIFTVFALVTFMLTLLSTAFPGALFSKRNFYGVIRVSRDLVGNPPQRANLMSHGITVHGLQFVSDLKVPNVPTTYYVPESGVGLAILNHPKYDQGQSMRVGLLGLGVGTLVTYARPGDAYRLYEINPVVIDLAAGVGDYFSFLSDSEADITTVPGDARISLQNELDKGQPQNFDVLVLDTFSSDSIPVHLVTKEALALYLAHLAPDGIIAAHITNLHLDLQPVFWRLAQYYGLSMARINYAGDSKGGYASHWILLARDPALLQIPAIQEHSVVLTGYSTNIKLWTDDYSNLFQILK